MSNAFPTVEQECKALEASCKATELLLTAEASLTAGQSLELPDAPERAFHIVQGSLYAAVTHLPTHSMAIISAGEQVSITAAEDTRIVLIGGEPLGRRCIEWNFVSSHYLKRPRQC